MVSPHSKGELNVMKYFSEKLNKTFDTPRACEEAEAQYDKEQERIKKELERAVKEKEQKEAELAKSKKEASKAIEEATASLQEANKLYEVARQKAADILDASNKEANSILDAAAAKVKKAQEERLQAVLAFNKKYGTYTTTLTGKEAADEYQKCLKELSNTFKNIWRDFWF